MGRKRDDDDDDGDVDDFDEDDADDDAELSPEALQAVTEQLFEILRSAGALRPDKPEKKAIRQLAKATKALRGAEAILELLGPLPVRVKPEPKPPRSFVRIPENRKKIELGAQLWAARSTAAPNVKFGRHIRNGFRVSASEASELMRIWRGYGTRPEIFERVSWAALRELSSPSMPAGLRMELEAKIVAGENVAASDIRRSRGSLPIGRSRRRERQAGRAAA